jgi:hypothetical protein
MACAELEASALVHGYHLVVRCGDFGIRIEEQVDDLRVLGSQVQGGFAMLQREGKNRQ